MIDLNSERYDFFSKMFEVFVKFTIDPNLNIANQNNWHQSHPFYRLNGYENIQISQSFGLYLVMNPEFLKKFDTIIEIGTYNGGLTLYINQNKKTKCNLVSYDIDGTINTVKSQNKYTDIDFRVQDCFEDSAFKDIVNMIQSNGKVLVLCDGGDKPKEFNTFSKYLKSGDHIMCHDYCKNEQIWKLATTFWQWPYHTDTNYTDIEDSINSNGLEPYNHDAYAFVFWGSYIKK